MERKKLSMMLMASSLLLTAASACTGDHDEVEGCRDCIVNQLDCDCPGCRSILRCLAGCLWNGVPQSKCVSTCDSWPEGGRPCLSDCKKCLSVCKCKCVRGQHAN